MFLSRLFIWWWSVSALGAGRDESLEYSPPAVSSGLGTKSRKGVGVGGLSVHTSQGPGPPLAAGTTQGTTVSPSGPLTTLSGR